MSEHRKPVRMAAAVLDAAIDRKWPAVQRGMQRLSAECNAEGLALALVAWCDWFAEHANGGKAEFRDVRIATWCADTGKIGVPVRESVRWATDLIQARARGDREAFGRLLDELNSMDGRERGRYVLELIESVALTIRSTPRGYAHMGGGGRE